MDATEHRREVEGQRARRIARLRSGVGWLALVDRIWLDPGDNETPVGILSVGDAVTLDGAPLAIGTSIERDGRRYELGTAGERLCLRVWDPSAPAAAPDIPFFDVQPAWRVVARFTPFEAPHAIVMPFSSGDTGVRPSPGSLDFEIDGRPLRLLPVVEPDPKPRLFVLFGDPTNRDLTYPAGRFLYAPMPEDGATVLDFNLAMNPACAFNDLVICPLPPPENRLPIRVEAGEKRYERPA